MSGFYTWDPDLKVLGGEARRSLWGSLGLVAQAERQCQAVQMRQEAYNRGDWLRPVRGGEVEYLQIMPQVQRQTRVFEVSNSGLGKVVSVSKGQLVFGGLLPLASIVTVRPGSAAPAFSIGGGQLRANIASQLAPADIVAQAQQANGLFSVVRVRTSHGSVLVDSVQYGSNLTDCQATQALNSPDLIGAPPASGHGHGPHPRPVRGLHALLLAEPGGLRQRQRYRPV